MDINLRSKYYIYYNNKNYGEIAQKKAKIFNLNYNLINIMLDKVPSVIDTEIDIEETNEKLILNQNLIYFDLDDNFEEGYKLYKQKENKIIYDKNTKEIVSYNIDIKESIDNNDMIIISNYIFDIIKDINYKTYNIFINECTNINIKFSNEEIFTNIMLLIKQKELFDIFNKIWEKMPGFILSKIGDNDFISLLEKEKDNNTFKKLDDDIIKELSNKKVYNLPNNILKLTREEWDIIISISEKLKNTEGYNKNNYNYNDLFNSLSLFIDKDYNIKDLFNYIIIENFLYIDYNKSLSVFELLDEFANFIIKADKLGLNYNKYPKKLKYLLSIFNYNYEHFKRLVHRNINPGDNREEKMVNKLQEINIEKNNMLIEEINNKGYKAKQIINYQEFIDNIFNNIPSKYAINSFFNKDNIFIIKNENKELIWIFDKDNNLIFEYIINILV